MNTRRKLVEVKYTRFQMRSGSNMEYSNHFHLVQHFYFAYVLYYITTKPQSGPGGAAWVKSGYMRFFDHIFFPASLTSVVYVH